MNLARWIVYDGQFSFHVGTWHVTGNPERRFKRQFFPDGKVYVWIYQGPTWNYLTQYVGLSDRSS